ncbi:hypothetical protein Acsp06_29660 [Actinomycetospora sp. NBRC 106375]|uniref:hypothetical protein n=1 Tax=Actinomycetospora sp. NBRC 106375 TaxID=3032207 RepID=UPI0024A1A93C|nr:hypothetical protein [Actinomycetospora sp. NBRC 106375]GLZ46781.1 hypothetical protein Acsp06_29660 [Actinomycetospora sp. NBRC 106375]
MSDVHAIFRQVGHDQWEAYSRPVSVYAGGSSLPVARDEWARAAEAHLQNEWPNTTVIEHVEHEVAPDIFIRTAVDHAAGRRERVANVLRDGLARPEVLATTRRTALESSAGDIVFVCCLPTDRIQWVSEQLGRMDAVQVSAPYGQEGGVWWMPLASPNVEVEAPGTRTLHDAGLGGPDATIADLVAVIDSDHGGPRDAMPGQSQRKRAERTSAVARRTGALVAA